MKKQLGHTNMDGLVLFLIVGLIAVLAAVLCPQFLANHQYQESKEDQQLIEECERELPRGQECEIIKVAKPRNGEQK